MRPPPRSARFTPVRLLAAPAIPIVLSTLSTDCEGRAHRDGEEAAPREHCFGAHRAEQHTDQERTRELTDA